MPTQSRSDRLRSAWATTRAVVGVVLGLVPHVMHHVGLIAGAALLTGALGNGILYVLGLLLSIPMLRRLHTRFRTQWAPIVGVAIFTALFGLSAFVVGPAISGGGAPPPSTPSPPAVTTDEHGH